MSSGFHAVSPPGTGGGGGGAVTQVSGSGAGITVNPTTGSVVITNTGVTSETAGAGLSVNAATGAVTYTNLWGANPATTIGDLLYANQTQVNPSFARLAAGTSGFVLTANGAGVAPSWQASSAGFANPMTTTGDIIMSNPGATAVRLGIGATGNVLTVAGGLPSWAAPAASVTSAVAGAGISVSGATGAVTITNTWGANPATTIGDVIIANQTQANPSFTRLGMGAAYTSLNVNAGATTLTYLASHQSLMTATGDVLYASGANTPARLAVGGTNQVLTVVGGVPTWQNSSAGFANPMTTQGDIITGGAAGAAGRLGIGTAFQVLGVNSGATAPVWAASASSTLTTTGDLLYASAANTLQRLGIGATGQVLTVTGGVPVWANSAAGFANPMTTQGDIITGGAAGAAGRLAIGTAFQSLQVNSGATAPVWAASAASTLTTTGDMLYASAANTPARRAIGTAGQVLTVSGGLPTWATPSGGAAITASPASLTIGTDGTLTQAGAAIPTTGSLGTNVTSATVQTNSTGFAGQVSVVTSGSIAAASVMFVLTFNATRTRAPLVGLIHIMSVALGVNAWGYITSPTTTTVAFNTFSAVGSAATLTVDYLLL